MFSYKVFEVVQEFSDELNIVLKCPGCSHIFSPGMSNEELREFHRER